MQNLYSDSIKKRILYMILRRELKIPTANLINFLNSINKFDEISKWTDDQISNILFTGKYSLQNNQNLIKSIKEKIIFDQYFKHYNSIIKLCNDRKVDIFCAYEKNTPLLIQQIKPQMRDILFIRGNLTQDDLKNFSICGTREPTLEGGKAAYDIASYFSQKGFSLINGYAKGIDIEAFKGVKHSNGRYIGVLGSGVLNIYPSEHNEFSNYIVNNGALISQRIPNLRVTRQTLQIRNRLTAALSLVSIFIEGTYKSGTKWQLKFARELKKPIFYFEPKNWEHKNSYIPKMVKKSGGIQINNDLSNLDDIYFLILQTLGKFLENIDLNLSNLTNKKSK